MRNSVAWLWSTFVSQSDKEGNMTENMLEENALLAALNGSQYDVVDDSQYETGALADEPLTPEQPPPQPRVPTRYRRVKGVPGMVIVEQDIDDSAREGDGAHWLRPEDIMEDLDVSIILFVFYGGRQSEPKHWEVVLDVLSRPMGTQIRILEGLEFALHCQGPTLWHFRQQTKQKTTFQKMIQGLVPKLKAISVPQGADALGT